MQETLGKMYCWVKQGIEPGRFIVFLIQHRLPLSIQRYHSAWSMGVDDFNAIFEAICGYRPKESICLVELGAGISTLVLAHVIPRLFKSVRIISIEGSEQFAEQYQELIMEYNLSSVVSVHHVPYVIEGDYSWFSKDELKHIVKGNKIDVLLVDAPWRLLCSCARQPAIPFFLPYMNNGGAVFLHDAHREDERRIAEQWSRYFSPVVI